MMGYQNARIPRLSYIASQIAACDSKCAYRTEAKAMLAIDSLHRSKISKRALKPYRCPVCGDWHLTKQVG